MRHCSPNGDSRPARIKEILARLLQRGGVTAKAFGLLTIGALVTGCGGGGGSGDGAGVSPQVVSGVAATGSALVGQVTLKDSTSRQEKVTNIASDGSFAIDVADRTAPFILKATGTADGVSHTLFSFAAQAGTANVNPLSSVAVANAAGVDDPAEAFDKSDLATLSKVKSGMQDSVAALQSKLKPLLDAFEVGAVDPVTAPFTANHEGLDGVFDNVKVVVAGGTLTMTNVTTGAVVFTSQVKDIATGNFSDDGRILKRPARPAAPTGVTALGGDGQVTVSWEPVPNATSYDLVYAKAAQSKAAEEEDTEDAGAKRVKNVTSPFVVAGLDVSTTYFVTVRARNNGRRGPASVQVSATTNATPPVVTVPAAPAGVSATGGTKQVTVSWAAVSGATSFNLYWSTTTGVTTLNGTKISGIANPPAVHPGLIDNTTYFYVVTSVNSAGESAASAQVDATTLAAGATTTTTAPTTSTTTTAGQTTTTTARPTTTTTTVGQTTTTAAPTTTTARPTTTTAAPTTTTSARPTTTTTTASTTTTTLAPALDGVAIYNANCAGCHGANGKRSSTASQISAAIASVSAMRGISLSPAQIAAIAARP